MGENFNINFYTLIHSVQFDFKNGEVIKTKRPLKVHFCPKNVLQSFLCEIE